MALNPAAFKGVPIERLQELRTAYTDCLVAIAEAGQTYTISGRTYTRADMNNVQDLLTNVNSEISRLTGTSRKFAQAQVRSRL